MKLYYSVILLFILATSVLGQQDPEAKKILDRVSAKTKNYSTIQADFELIITNRPENKSTNSKGLVKIKGKKYYMESMGTKVYYDGKTLWSFLEDINEVTISEPDDSSGDFVENPALIFEFYNRDFKYHLVGEARLESGWMYEIDLFPSNLDQPYSRFKLYISKEKEDLYMVKAIGKEGTDYTVYIRNAKYNEPISDDTFTFDPKKHKGIEIVDLRF